MCFDKENISPLRSHRGRCFPRNVFPAVQAASDDAREAAAADVDVVVAAVEGEETELVESGLRDGRGRRRF